MDGVNTPGMVRGNTLPSIPSVHGVASPSTARTVQDVAIEPRSIARASTSARLAGHAKHDKGAASPRDATTCIMENHPLELERVLRAAMQAPDIHNMARRLREQAHAGRRMNGRTSGLEAAKRMVDKELDEMAPTYASYLSTALLTRHKKCVRALLRFYVVRDAPSGAGQGAGAGSGSGSGAYGTGESKGSVVVDHGEHGLKSSLVTVCPTTVRVCQCEGALLQEPTTCDCFKAHKHVPELDEFRPDAVLARDDDMLTGRNVGHFAAAVAWGDIDVFKWMLEARRGARLVEVGNDGVQATVDATRSMLNVGARPHHAADSHARREDMAYLNLLM